MFALSGGWLVGRSVSPLIVLLLYNRLGQKKQIRIQIRDLRCYSGLGSVVLGDLSVLIDLNDPTDLTDH